MRRFLVAGAFTALALHLLLLLPLASAVTAKAKAKAPAAPPPAPAPPNITALMSKGGCKAFASLVSRSPDALSAYQSAVGGGVTAFCPTDDAVRAFAPSYRNLTADEAASLLLFHAVPVYYTLRGLKSSNGPMNTLATDAGASSSYNLTVQNVGDQVTVRTPVSGSGSPARVRSTVYDSDPVAIYAVDAVLEPVELFDPAAEAPAPAPKASSSSAAKRQRQQRRRHGADAPGPAADDEDATPADQRKGSGNNTGPGAPCCPRWLAVVAVAVAAALAA